MSRKEIALALGISLNTVKVYIHTIYGKLGLQGNPNARAYLENFRVAS